MQSKLTKFHHAYDRYWNAVEKALVDQYHRDDDTAIDWAIDKRLDLEDEHGDLVIPATPPERMAQEIFMERAV
jgi:hypothetical protein